MKRIRKSIIYSLLSDETGQISSKRAIGIICALTLCFSLIYSMFSKLNNPISDSLVNSIAMIAGGGLGLSSAEKIMKIWKGEDHNINNMNNE